MAQVASSPRNLVAVMAKFAAALVLLAVIALAFVFQQSWLPPLRTWLAAKPEEHAAHDDHATSDPNAIEISPQARKNIGLLVEKVQPRDFPRTISIPGIVVERPGRSTLKITTPMTGIVTQIYPIEGEAVSPGQKLFELRLTHEEIVQAQADLLRTAEELDVTAREIERLEKASADGAIAGKTLLERKYEQQKLTAANRSQQQALLLHGLTDGEVKGILKDRSLLKNVTISAPTAMAGTKFQLQQLAAAPGQHVQAGELLATLIDYSSLLIEGDAFERDAAHIDKAVQNKATVTALLDREGAEPEVMDGLRILYQGSRIDPDTRSVHFYVGLPNEVREEPDADTQRSFLNWRYRPGQRMQLQVTVEVWPQRLVLPVSAIAQEGVETYVFTPNGKNFERRPVHVEHRDDRFAVVANDGSIFPGEQVAMTGAQQLQLALKNKSGGPIDPHAGHSH